MKKDQIKLNLKNGIKKVAFVFAGLALALVASYVSAMGRPADITTNAPEVLNVGDATQVKDGFIRVLGFIAGDYISQKNNGYNFTLIDKLGAMSIGKNNTPDASSGISLDIAGTTDILGSIRSKDLEGAGLREVCADKDGKIVFCTKEQEFVSKDSNKPTYYGIMVPDGVKSMTVEIYGAGGAGYSKINRLTGSDDGQSSFIIGDGVNIVVGGGKGADLANVGGKGGKIIDSTGGSNVYYQDGSDGGTPPSSYTTSPSQYGSSNKCSGVTYITIKGAKGNVGGKGGKPYNGSNIDGGSAGNEGPVSGTYISKWSFNIVSTESTPPVNYTDCNYAGQSSDDYTSSPNKRPGGDGLDGASFGAGGSGFGGKGGLSKVSSDAMSNCTDCKGGLSGSGGGAGAYIKATIDTTIGGNTFYLKVGNGGKLDTDLYQCQGTGGSNSCLKDLGGGALPGKGAPGYIKITYNN